MENKERIYWVVLAETPGIGPVTFFDLLAKFDTAEAVWKATPDELRKNEISERIRKLLLRRRKLVDPKRHISVLARRGVEVVTMMDPEYPQHLLGINKSPPVLFVRGRLLPEDNNSLAVVGTRKPTSYGRNATEKLVSDLVSSGLTIVSGLARGIDGIAHRTALDLGGRTVAFLGGGIDNIYPSEHKVLAEKIVKNGALISEFPPGFQPSRGNFPARNRLISGMSLGVLVVEGLSKSGTKHTVNHALSQGKPVFAVPGPITSKMSDAPMDMISDGAHMVRKAEDILKVLGVDGNMGGDKQKQVEFENDTEKIIYSLIENEPLSGDEIIRLSNFNPQETMTTLSMMELKGMIKNVGGEYLKS
ncbi:DNA-processing protein DprA [Patescibacteria group bacterium]